MLNVEGKTSERRRASKKKGIEEKGHRRKGIEHNVQKITKTTTHKKIDETNLEHREDTEKPGYK